MLDINLKNINVYVLALKYLERKYKHLLQKNEVFEINSDANCMQFYFRIFDTKLSQTVNKKYYSQLKDEICNNINEQYYEFKPTIINYFKKCKINVDTYNQLIINYIVYIICINKTNLYDNFGIFFPKTHFKKIYISNKILNNYIIDKLSKAGIDLIKNSRYTHLEFTHKTKEIYTYLKLAGEINVN